ncbi:MAG: IS3 family transposase [Bifidobacterium longum]
MTPSSQSKATRQTIPATYRSREARLSIRDDAGRPSSSRRAITTRTASTQVAAISVRPAAPAPERPGTSAASWSSRTPSPKCCPAATPSCAMEPQSRQPIGDCIRWHDHERIKRSLGWMSPVQYRQSQGTAA